MKEYKFVGTFKDNEGNEFTATEYVYAISMKDAVNCFLREYKPNYCQWELVG